MYRAAKVVATPPETFRESRWRPAELLLAFLFPDRNLKTPIQPIGHVTGICLRYCHCNLQSKNLLLRCRGLAMMIYGICQGWVIAETVYKNHIWACISSIIWIKLPHWHPLDALPSFPIVARHQFGWPVDIVQPPQRNWIQIQISTEKTYIKDVYIQYSVPYKDQVFKYTGLVLQIHTI